MSHFMIVATIVLFLLCWFLIAKKYILNKYATVKTVQAKVIDKYKPNIASVYYGSFKPTRYIVVFETKDKKLSFHVSEFSYGSYQINETGTLQYKGNKLISFQ